MRVALSSKTSFQFKNQPFHLTVLQLFSTDLALFAHQLKEKVGQAPRFFQNTAVVLDLQKLVDTEDPLDFKKLSFTITQCHLQIVGLRNGSKEQQAAAQAAGLTLLADNAPLKEERIHTKSHSPTRVVTQPVRSGQQIYAKGGDLLVLAPVSAGAELLADGHIHVYGALRGRALAGVGGDPHTHIFCRSLEAELVSIAGHYRISEDLKESLWRSPAHICLQEEELKIYHIE